MGSPSLKWLNIMTKSFSKYEYYFFFSWCFYQSYICLWPNIYLLLSKTNHDNNELNVMTKLPMINDVDRLSENYYRGDLDNRDYR